MSSSTATPSAPLRHRPFLLMLLASAGTFSGYSLLMPVVPLWAVRQGESEAVAGAATGVFMASTVLVQFAVPRFLRAYGYRAGLALGATLIGAPALALLVGTGAASILGISFARGLGFGLITVCGSALIAELLPANLLARGSGLYGLAVGLPQLVWLPAGTAVVEQWGFEPVFVLATALPLAALLPALGLPRTFPRDEGTRTGLGGARDLVAATWRPWLPMLAVSTGFGALVTFLPIVLPTAVASVALLVIPAMTMAARWVAGQFGDRMGAPGRMLFGALLCGAVGMTAFALLAGHSGPAVATVVAVAVFGASFGVVQNDALLAMFARAPAATASVSWNIAFDGGQGLGAVLVGAVIAATSVTTSFGLLAAVAVVLLPVAWRVGRGR
ncbi:MFS transporter [Saccharomonospora iraqiensis]|uniref:MFS transporter n=1 Tax=Saccharomonospora iraqiensis TaxID=52698 RepID=UPI00022E0E70|nr:MFS transporter [Saccharomonospora iraqiensis]